jgi:hypothetical protein
MNKLLQIPKILYHGTTTFNNEYLTLKSIDKIDVNYGDKLSDFGQGFYLTSVYKQALSYARMKANRNTKFGKICHPVIIKYELDIEGLQQNCNGTILDKPDEKWTEFIYNNRVKSETECISHFHNRAKMHDYVYGYLADGKIATIIDEYRKNKEININSLSKEIRPYFSDNNDQCSLHSKDAIKYLKFIEILYDKSYKKR